MKNYLDAQGVQTLLLANKKYINDQSFKNNVQIIKIVIKEEQYTVDETTQIASGSLLADDLTELQEAITNKRVFLLQVDFPSNTIIFESVTKNADNKILCLHNILVENEKEPEKPFSAYFRLEIDTANNTFTLQVLQVNSDSTEFVHMIRIMTSDIDTESSTITNPEVIDEIKECIEKNILMSFYVELLQGTNHSYTLLNENEILIKSLTIDGFKIIRYDLQINLTDNTFKLLAGSIDAEDYALKENTYTKDEVYNKEEIDSTFDDYVNIFEPIILDLGANPEVIPENILSKINDRINNNQQLFLIAIQGGAIASQNTYFAVPNELLTVELSVEGSSIDEDNANIKFEHIFKLNLQTGEYQYDISYKPNKVHFYFSDKTQLSESEYNELYKTILLTKNVTVEQHSIVFNYITTKKDNLYFGFITTDLLLEATDGSAKPDDPYNSVGVIDYVLEITSTGKINTYVGALNVNGLISTALQDYYNKSEIDSKVTNINNQILATNNKITENYTTLNTKIDTTKAELESTISGNQSAINAELSKLNSYFTNGIANGAINDGAGNNIVNTYSTKTELNEFVQTTAPNTYVAIADFKTNYLDSNHVAYKSDFDNYYTIAEVDEIVNGIKDGIVQIVDELPAEPKIGIIYLLKTDTENDYEKRTRENNKWVSLGNTVIDLTGYVIGTNLTAENIILGNGNSAIKSSGKTITTAIIDSDNAIPTSKAIKTELDKKQVTLVSGTNIKTVNGESILGSGNISTIQDLSNYANKLTENIFSYTQYFNDKFGITIGATNINEARLLNVNTQIGKVPAIETNVSVLQANLGNLSVVVDSKADKTYVDTELDKKSDITHNHDDVYVKNEVNAFDPNNFQDQNGWLYHTDGKNEIGNTDRTITLYGTDVWYNNGQTSVKIATEPYVDNKTSTKQDTLVSGTNIKTVNNQTLLGSGNIDTKETEFINIDNITITSDGASGQFTDDIYGKMSTGITENKHISVTISCNLSLPEFEGSAIAHALYLNYIPDVKAFEIQAFTSIGSISTTTNRTVYLFTVYVDSTNAYLVHVFRLQKELVSGTNIKTVNGQSLLGSGNINVATDLTGYVTTDELTSTISETVSAINKNISVVETEIETNTTNIQSISTELNNKVDKVSGKQLSENDFTTEYKNQLDTLADTYATKEALSTLIGNAPENFDTLKEIADYLTEHQSEVTDIVADIATKQDKTDSALTTTEKTVVGAINELDSGKQDVITGTQLSALNSGITSEIVEKINNNQLEYLPLTGGTVNGQVTIDNSSDEFQENVESIAYKVRFKTGSNQIGAVSFGKESANNGAMVKFEQVEGTTRLQFRASNTPGAMVWRQPEASSQLYLDVDSINFRLKGNGEVKGFRLNQDYFRPNNNNVGSLGDSTHNFLALYATTVYENGSSIAEKYALKSETPNDVKISNSKIILSKDDTDIGTGINIADLKIALDFESEIGAYLPLTGGILTGNLTAPTITLNGEADSQYTAKLFGGQLTHNVVFHMPTTGGTLTTQESVDTKLAEKQANLVAGTNIKNINNESVLGSGSIFTGFLIDLGTGTTENPEHIFTAEQNTNFVEAFTVLSHKPKHCVIECSYSYNTVNFFTANIERTDTGAKCYFMVNGGANILCVEVVSTGANQYKSVATMLTNGVTSTQVTMNLQ